MSLPIRGVQGRDTEPPSGVPVKDPLTVTVSWISELVGPMDRNNGRWPASREGSSNYGLHSR